MDHVYFIRCGEDGPIKIGWSTDVSRRITEIAQGLPDPAILIAQIPGGRELEARLHRALTEYRRRNEWFHPVQEVRALSILAKTKGLPAVLRWLSIKEAAIVECPTDAPATDDFEADLRAMIALGFKFAIDRHGYPTVCKAVGRSRDAVGKYVSGKSIPSVEQLFKLIELDPGSMSPFMARCGDVPECMQSTPYPKPLEV